ncbi:hypothetical protein EJB05_50163, partial [Eragrostis curvula]
MAGLSDLDFSPGLDLQRKIADRFGTSVSPSSPSLGFILVASFSRSALRINVDSVGLVLQSCLGGSAADFRVQFLKDWCFRFEVHSKAVGFLINSLRSFSCQLFAIHFTLWGNGGPNWQREFAKWCEQQDQEWTLVTRKRSYAAVVRDQAARVRPPPMKTVFQRLAFPDNYHLNFVEELQQVAVDPKDRQSVFTRIQIPETTAVLSDPSVQAQHGVRQTRRVHQHANSNSNLNGQPVFRDAPVMDSVNSYQEISHNQFNGNCFRCLAWGHTARFCKGQIRCRNCYKYGHVQRVCRARKQGRFIYKRKDIPWPSSQAIAQVDLAASSTAPLTFITAASPACISLPFTSQPVPSPSTDTTFPPLSPDTSAELAARLAAMANNPVDPWPLVPPGFTIINPAVEEDTPQRVFAFLGTAVRRINEAVAIAILDPEVDPIDYPHVSNAIHSFVVNKLRLNVTDVCPSGLGACTITFSSCAAREVAMSKIHRMEPYSLKFIPHDAGRNLRHLPMDRICWLMLVNFPLDCLDETSIATAISSFGNLLNWHASSNKARVVIRVLLNSSARVPHSVVVAVGDEPYARTWSVACYLLREENIQARIDPDPLPPHGRTPHPPPPPPPRWMGNDRQQYRGRAAEGTGSCYRNGSALSGQHWGSENMQEQGGRQHVVPSNPPQQAPANQFAEVVPVEDQVLVAPAEEEAPVADHDVEHGGQENSEAEHESSDIAEIEGPADFPRRRRKRVVPHDTTLLRRSSRLEAINKGFRAGSSAAALAPATTPGKSASSAATTSRRGRKAKPKTDAGTSSEIVLYEGHSLPGVAAAPHLPLETAQAIGANFCRMQPSAVTARALLQSDDDSDAE